MGHYVYKYVLNDEIIYIGKNDTDLHSRIATHGKRGDNISEDGWSEINAATIYYIKLANSTMSDVVESELIRKYKPKYNVAKKSDWTGLPFVEPEWIRYKPKKRTEKCENNKQIRTKEHKVKDYYSNNKGAIRFLNYIYDCIFNKDFYITQDDKYNYHMNKKYRDEYYLWIRMPEWYDENNRGLFCYDGCHINGIVLPLIRYSREEGYWACYSALFTDYHPLLDNVETLYKITEHQFGIDNIPEDMETLYQKYIVLKEQWNQYIDINDKNTWREPPEDPGKNIKKYNDKIAKRNNDYFWKWYDGCSIIYTNGGGYYIYKDKRFSEFICNYDKSFREFPHKDDPYFLEEYINNYFSYWAIELDNVIWVTSLGTVFCGDFYGTFLSTADEYGLINEDGPEDIRRAVEVIAKNRIKHGVGKKH